MKTGKLIDCARRLCNGFFQRVSSDFNSSTAVYDAGLEETITTVKAEEYPLKSPDVKMGLSSSYSRYESFDNAIDVYDGALVALHDPFELPTKKSFHFFMQPDKPQKILIDVEQTTTDGSVLEEDLEV
jgi:hypothetical protein